MTTLFPRTSGNALTFCKSSKTIGALKSDDAALPLQEVVVFLKAAPRETDPEILAFRKELEEQPGMRVFHFQQLESLKTEFEQVASGWVQQIAEAGRLRV